MSFFSALLKRNTKVNPSEVHQLVVRKNVESFSSGYWIGRVKNHKGEHRVVTVDNGKVKDLSAKGIWSVASLLQHKSPLEIVKDTAKTAPVIAESIQTLLENSITNDGPKLISPHDLSSMKAAGVVFVKSLLERVVEEQAKGDPEKAFNIRAELSKLIGKQLDLVKPGSKEAKELLRILTEEKGVSRHYLEVGLGPDAELFTKAQPMSSIGFGANLGINPTSSWNNPEPEVVVISNIYGRIVGSSLGNDVNLRDWEGRSALLLGRAKDVNGSCVIGPMIRLIDSDKPSRDSFTLDDIRSAEVKLVILGRDQPFLLEDKSSMKEIGRDVTDLVGQAMKAHQYPDGLFLMTGTMFAPVEDRDPINAPGAGFTHKEGDHVIIESEKLGCLYNVVNYCNVIPPWDFGIVKLIEQLKNSN